jgi:voltage-dependent anion channel protein 2
MFIEVKTNETKHFMKKNGILKSEFKHDSVSVNADVDLNAGPVVHGSAVAGYLGWMARYQMSFDVFQTKIVHNNFSIAYVANDFALHRNVYVTIFISC